MASAAEQLAANLNLGVLSRATELKKRLWFTLGALIVSVLGGALWGLLAQWPCAARSWVGAIGCGAAAALHFSGDEK